MFELQRKTGIGGRGGGRRRGLSAVEVIVLITLMGLFVMVAVMMLPRGREAARMAGCRRNLMQIGVALALYDQSQQSLPLIPPPGDASAGAAAAAGVTGPLTALLAELGLPDFTGLEDSKNRPPTRPGPAPGERRVPGFVCASDPHAIAALFPAPVSYRATTGDAPDGRDGAFAPGRRVGIDEIEATDGAGYTAAFSERLAGDGRDEHPATSNYALVPGPLDGAGCPQAAPDAWRGDAGSSWVAADWRSTLYNHALTPGASPSC